MNKVIGIIGGGQLAKMSSYAATRLGFQVLIIDKAPDSPAAAVSNSNISGWVDNKNDFENFIEKSDVITLENEFIDFSYLKKIEERGKKVVPSAKTISLIQDKLIQKETFSNFGLPVAKFRKVDENTSYNEVVKSVGLPFVLKSRKMGYDGYGNAKIESESEYDKVFNKLFTRGGGLLAEEFIEFKKELAIILVRNSFQTIAYPVVETIQENHICHTVIAEAEVDEIVKKSVLDLGILAIDSIEGLGIFGIEFFLTKENKVIINEIAPRPHNTGHYTIEGCSISQFENHIRAVLDLPLGSTKLINKYAIMMNLLGKREGEGFPKNYNEVLSEIKDLHLHIYGKDKDRIGRKMGHITMIGNNKETLLSKMNKVLIKIDL